MLKREDYLTLIEEIRNTDIKSLDEFIRKRLEPLRIDNENLVEILYKDVHYLIKDIDEIGDNDLVIENGDFVVEDGDFKLTGYQSRLHILSIWLHMEVFKKIIENNLAMFAEGVENFEKNYLNKPDYTPEYKAKLDVIKKSLKKERKMNLGEEENYESINSDEEEISNQINEIIKDHLSKLGLGQELIFEELQELKALYTTLKKKNWIQLVKEKLLLDLPLGKLVENDTISYIGENM